VREGWRKAAIGEVCEVVNGGTPKTGVRAYWGGPHMWITPAEMGRRDDPHVGGTARRLTDAGLAAANLLPPRSVILSSRAPIGHLVINTVPMATNQGCKGLVPKAGVDHKYLFYYLGSIVGLLNDLGTGATFKELSGAKLKEIPIPLPPLPEQRRLVVIFDQVFARLVTMTANAEKNLCNARELFDSYLNSVFAKKWEERFLGDISENLDSRRVPVTKKDRKAGSIPYYGASGVVDHVADFIFDEHLLLVSEDGANLLMRTYPIAFSVSGKSWVNNHAHVLRFPDLSSQRFVEYYLNSISLKPYVNGMAQPKLNQRALNAIAVPFPPVDERQRAVIRLDDLAMQTERLREMYTTRIAALAELRQSILQKAFSGELSSPPSLNIKEAAE
jgi:type I restriction enzyme, S subunit